MTDEATTARLAVLIEGWRRRADSGYTPREIADTLSHCSNDLESVLRAFTPTISPAPITHPQPGRREQLHEDAMALAYDDADEWAVGYFTDGYKANLLAKRIEGLITKYAAPPTEEPKP